jgi:hypothetical protein
LFSQQLIISHNVTRAQLDKHAPWHKQDVTRISKVFIRVRYPEFILLCTLTNFYPQSKAQVPFLRRFASDWATAQIVRLQLKNRRAYKRRLDLPEDADIIEESGNDDGAEGEDMEE